MNNNFSENLKKLRKENNLSQEQLADELGVSRQAISKWESGSAYPEMDKIIALCDKFNLNIDDLLHKDIKEIKGEEESKKKINRYIEDFLKYITDTINLFSNMNFKSKIKCLFEQAVIIIILIIISNIIISLLGSIFENILNFLPHNIKYFIINILNSVITLFFTISSIIIIAHIFKTRYLDYYNDIKKEKNTDEQNKEEKITLKENKIIIRDPKHSEYKFINGLFKLIILAIKFFLLCFAFFIALALIGLSTSLISALMLYKTGLFFIGLITTILSSSTILVLILILILNFIFNRKNDKKKIIWGFIISIISFGIGCGLIFIGTLDFEIVETNELMQDTKTTEHKMQENLRINTYNVAQIKYIETESTNIKIEYQKNKYCDIEEQIDEENNTITPWTNCKQPTKLVKEVIKNINDKKIIPINDNINKMTIYTTKENIEKLKNNTNDYNKYDRTINPYETRINELENENEKLIQKINELENE